MTWCCPHGCLPQWFCVNLNLLSVLHFHHQAWILLLCLYNPAIVFHVRLISHKIFPKSFFKGDQSVTRSRWVTKQDILKISAIIVPYSPLIHQYWMSIIWNYLYFANKMALIIDTHNLLLWLQHLTFWEMPKGIISVWPSCSRTTVTVQCLYIISPSLSAGNKSFSHISVNIHTNDCPSAVLEAALGSSSGISLLHDSTS